MARQHATPVHIPASGPASALIAVSQTGAGGVLEDHIQALVHEHPSILPIAEIDPIFKGAVAVCRELETPAGPIDNFLVTPSGLPVLVECKLWRNAEARREVVGQILDYAKELARFTVSDLQREVAKRLGGGRIVAPRVLAHTHVITRTVVALPDGHTVEDEEAAAATEAVIDPEAASMRDASRAFWAEFLDYLAPRLDDREQPLPRPPRMGYVTFSLPAPSGTSWLTVYRERKTNEVGLFLSAHRDTAGDYARRVISEDWATVGPLLDGTATLTTGKDGLPFIADKLRAGNLEDPAVRARAFEWLAERTNTFINVLRPRVRSAAADYQGQ